MSFPTKTRTGVVTGKTEGGAWNRTKLLTSRPHGNKKKLKNSPAPKKKETILGVRDAELKGSGGTYRKEIKQKKGGGRSPEPPKSMYGEEVKKRGGGGWGQETGGPQRGNRSPTRTRARGKGTMLEGENLQGAGKNTINGIRRKNSRRARKGNRHRDKKGGS